MKIKNIVGYVLLILLPNLVFGQGWFEDNPKWTNKMLGSTIIDGIRTLTVVGDTIINGQSCKLLNRNSNYKKLNSEGDTILNDVNSNRFAYELDDKVYFYNSWVDDFQLSYDFNLNTGDYIVFEDLENCDSDTIEIYDKGIITIDGVDLRFQKLLFYQDHKTTELMNIIEKIGYYQMEIIDSNGISNTSYPFAYLNMTYHFDCVLSEPPPNPICYQNDDIDFMYTNIDCEGMIITSLNESSNKFSLKLFPIPFEDKIHFENTTAYQIKSYKVFDVSGSIISNKQINSGPGEFTTVTLPNSTKGIYYLRVLLSNGDFITSKLIK